MNGFDNNIQDFIGNTFKYNGKTYTMLAMSPDRVWIKIDGGVLEDRPIVWEYKS